MRGNLLLKQKCPWNIIQFVDNAGNCDGTFRSIYSMDVD